MSQPIPSIGKILEDPDWGEECPVCGDPFTPENSGVLWPELVSSGDVFAWERLCQSPAPDELQEWVDERDHDNEYPMLPVMYVHTVTDL